MKTIIHHTSCPACGSDKIQFYQIIKDYSVSGEEFPLAYCLKCTLRFTQDIPDTTSISPYYQSDAYISHSNTSKGFINQLYHKVRKTTLTTKRKTIEKHTGLTTGKLLDIGSGTGAFAKEMLVHGWEVTGLEPDAQARHIALKEHDVLLQEAAAIQALPSHSFDVITLWHVLEHVHDLREYMHQLKRLLKPNGRIFIALPNYTSTDAAVYGKYWAAYDVPRHLYHFSPTAVRKLIQQHGFRMLTYLPMWFDSFYISMLSSKYKHGSTNWIGAMWTGFRSNVTALMNTQKCSSVIYIINHDEFIAIQP